MMMRLMQSRSKSVKRCILGVQPFRFHTVMRLTVCGVLITGAFFSIGCTAENAATEQMSDANVADVETEASMAMHELQAPNTEQKQDAEQTPDHQPMTLALEGGRFEEGKHYEKLKGVPQYLPTEKIKVIEFFSYGCPHCYHMEETLTKWQKNIPSSIEFERVPAFWNPFFQIVAQAFYTMEVMQLEDRVHERLFTAIHEQRKKLDNKAAVKQVFVEAGADPAEFDQAFDSFAVQQKMNMADKLFKTYKLDHVPVFVIGGQYVTDVSKAGSQEAVLEVIEYLARKMKMAQKEKAAS